MSGMAGLEILLWVFTGLTSLMGAIDLYGVIVSTSASAPQQGAAAAVAIGCAVIPYVIARTIAGVNSASDRRKMVGLLEQAHGPLIVVPPPLGT